MQFTLTTYAVTLANTGIVLTGLIAMVFFHERQKWRMLLVAILTICGGLGILTRA